MPTTPATIADATAFADGTLVNSLESVDLPDIEQMSEEFQQLGMAGSIEVPSAHVALGTATLNFASYNPEDMKLFPPQQAVQLEVRMAINDVIGDRVGEFSRSVTMRILRQVRSNDSAERQRTEGPELEVAVHYLKDELAGEAITEVDPKNRVFVWDGEDILADRRASLGFE